MPGRDRTGESTLGGSRVPTYTTSTEGAGDRRDDRAVTSGLRDVSGRDRTGDSTVAGSCVPSYTTGTQDEKLLRENRTATGASRAGKGQ